MNHAKYVVGEVPVSGILSVLTAVILPATMSHSDAKPMFVEGTIVSAGFCWVTQSLDRDELSVGVGGDSVSLGVKSRPEDVKLLERTLNLKHY